LALAESLKTALHDRYLLARELGAGGMATVYLGEDVRHHRQVAVKVLKPELAAGLGPERFLREIEIAARLHHPHILPLYDSGEAAAFLFYVMPYVEGQSLRQKLVREGELPIAQAVRILRDVADALAYAHKHGVVHRDIKPENVMLEDRHALVTDFGVAKAVSAAGSPEAGGGRQTMTEAGMALGTPAYMSPEQAVADHHIDQRSDIYAFGVLAYELLAGRPPFVGTTPQAVLAAHVTTAPEPVAKYRASIPPALADLVMRCLEKRPADRWQTVDELMPHLETVLTPSGGTTPTATQPVAAASRRPWRAIAAGAVAVLLAIVAWLSLGRRRSPTLDPQVIAVAPFDVLDSRLQIWHEGIVDILARSLDGAGAFRTVAPSVVIGQWRGRADPASAQALGKRTGAAIVVYGSLVSSGRDSVRASAALLDAGTGRPLGEIERREAAASIDRLIDSVAFGLLRELSRTRPVGAFKRSGLGGHSLPALKAFLQGEQFMRAANFDSALSAYQQAIALDSAFPQAFRRAALAIGWSKNPFDPIALQYQLRAGALNHGLSPRDSLLTLIDSIQFAPTPDPAVRWALNKRVFAAANELTSRYPDDPEGWYALGEARWHNGIGPGLNATDRQVMEAFDRAIALDSSFAPAYEHQIQLALDTEGPESALRYLQAMRRRMARDVSSVGFRLTEAALRGQRAMFESLLDSASADELSLVDLNLGSWPDSTDFLRDVVTTVSKRPGATLFGVGTVRMSEFYRGTLLFRGHLAVACPGTLPPNATAWCALLGAFPPDSAARLLSQFQTAAEHENSSRTAWWGVYFGLPWWAGRRDVRTLTAIESAAARVRRRDSALLGFTDERYLLAAARGYLALARGDSTRALELFRTLPDTLCPRCSQELLTRAQLELARGDAAGALETLQYRNHWDTAVPYLILWELTRARAAEQVGQRDVALRSYQYVVDAWSAGDPPVQQYVKEARAALQRLTAEPNAKRAS